MKFHIVLVKYLLAALLIFVFPVYYAQSNTDTATVEIYKFQFNPQEITVKPGTTVRWINKEKRQYHSVWFEQLGEPEPDYFFPDEYYDRTFTEEGSFPYRCGPHPKMTGVVHVKQ
ncbi:MAG: plastocyanin/azurin family copper-binding protein [Gammaproteobacteria bacterium]|nr:plastocyanin/azurin family copper-binding protein [Gammaproteobacteria bacterium]